MNRACIMKVAVALLYKLALLAMLAMLTMLTVSVFWISV